MDANQKISLALLIGRAIGVYFIMLVLPKQYRLMKASNYPQLKKLRKILFASSLILFLGNLIPIAIDIVGIFKIGSFGLLLVYVFSNNFTAMLSAFMIWMVYKISEETNLE